MNLANLIPDDRLLIDLPPEKVGLQLLLLAKEKEQNGLFLKDGVAGPSTLFGGDVVDGAGYNPTYQNEIVLAVGEAWQWLENELLIMPAPQPNPTFSRLTRRGRLFANDPSRFGQYAGARNLPKTLLHPLLQGEAWTQVIQGNLDTAVFVAFKSVEETVRKAGGFETTDVGVSLMRKAFHKETGPLSRMSDPIAEREALSNMFAGSIGSYKNPHSHRTVGLEDDSEAHEMIILASHLLRIVDARSSEWSNHC